MFNLKILTNLPTLLFFLQNFYLFKILKITKNLFKNKKYFQLYKISKFKKTIKLLTP